MKVRHIIALVAGLASSVLPAPAAAQSWHARPADFDGEPFCEMRVIASDSTELAFLAAPELLASDTLWLFAYNPRWPYQHRVRAGEAVLKTQGVAYAAHPALTLDNGFWMDVDIARMPAFVSKASQSGFSLVVGGTERGPYNLPSMDQAWSVFVECIYTEFGLEPFPIQSDPFAR